MAVAADRHRPAAQIIRDLHIEPDWVLIYCVDGEAVRFERTGTHADLFGT